MGSTVKIYDGSTLLGLTVPNGSGQWSFTTETLSRATAHNFNSTATDVAGNVGSSGAAVYGTKDNDTITGSASNDFLSGGGGSNTFVFSPGKDVIIDFKATGSNHDTLQFDGSIFANAADALAHATQVGKDVVITYDATDTVTLVGVHLNQLTLHRFYSGVVLVRQAELGEVVSAGTPVVTIADVDHLWMRGYLNETDLGRVKWGQSATIHTDTFSDKTYQGRVSFISSQAEFTPKSVETHKERVTLVYRIKIDLDNPNHELKPGMPADAVIDVPPQ